MQPGRSEVIGANNARVAAMATSSLGWSTGEMDVVPGRSVLGRSVLDGPVLDGPVLDGSVLDGSDPV